MRDVNRRTFLGASATALAFGSASVSAGSPSTGSVDAQAQFQFDAKNTGYVDASPPEQYLTDDWNTGTYWGVFGTPAVVDDTIYVAMTGSNYSRGSGYAQALDAETGTELWKRDLEGKSETAPAVGGGLVYFGDRAMVHALDAADGTVEWRFEKGATASPALVDGTLYVSAYDGIYALDAADGSVKWKNTEGYEEPPVSYGQSVASAPAVADGTVYVSDNSGTVLALDAASGDVQWQEPIEGMAAPSVADGTVYVGSATVTALDAETGQVQWERGKDAGDDEWEVSNHSVAVHDGVVYSSAGNLDSGDVDKLLALDAETGDTVWKYSNDKEWFGGTPVVSGGRVYIWGTTLVVLDAEDGSLVGQFVSTGTSNGTAVVPTDDALYFGMSANDIDGIGGGLYRLVEDESEWNAPPTVEVEASSTHVHADESVTFTATGSPHRDGELYHETRQDQVVAVRWDFDGDGEAETTTTGLGNTPTFTSEAEYGYDEAGTYEATVTVEDSYGWTASDSVTVVVGGGSDDGGTDDGGNDDNENGSGNENGGDC